MPSTTVADRGSMRYTFHGGGPCDGALNGAVMPDPLASGSAGQPSSDHALARRATMSGSVTRVASPATTTSASRIDTAIEHRGSRWTLRAFRVAPVWNQNAPSSHRAPTAVTCALPSSLIVESHVVRALCASGAGFDPASSFSTTAVQSTGGSPSVSPKLMISMASFPFVVADHEPAHWSFRREVVRKVIAIRAPSPAGVGPELSRLRGRRRLSGVEVAVVAAS